MSEEPDPFTCIVLLACIPGQQAAMEAYEHDALELMRAHGGVLERRLAVEGDAWDELHELSFPTRAAFDAFLADPRREALAPARRACVRATELHITRVMTP